MDEFYGENEGLTVAEVELNSEDELFKSPISSKRGNGRYSLL